MARRPVLFFSFSFFFLYKLGLIQGNKGQTKSTR